MKIIANLHETNSKNIIAHNDVTNIQFVYRLSPKTVKADKKGQISVTFTKAWNGRVKNYTAKVTSMPEGVTPSEAVSYLKNRLWR